MRVCVFQFLLSLGPVVAWAQIDTARSAAPGMPKAGAEVSITTIGGLSYRGQLAAVGVDSVRLHTTGWDGRSVLKTIPRDSVALLQVMQRGASHTILGAAIGIGTGTLVGALAATANCIVFRSPQETAQSHAIFVDTVIAGGVLGALVGWAIRSDSWSEIPIGPVAVTVSPGARTLGIGLTLQL